MDLCLCYHSVPKEQELCQRLSFDTFKSHIKLLSKHFSFVSGFEAEAKKSRIHLTFDDGYRDNFKVMEFLNSEGIPATIFISGGFVEHSFNFYWDAINFILRKNLEQKYRNFKRNQNCDDSKFLGVLEISNLSFEARLKEIEILTQFLMEIGEHENVGVPLTQNQVVAISRMQNIRIGSHTYLHGNLGDGTDPETIRHEIQRDIQFYSSVQKEAITEFAYPFGTTSNFGKLSTRILGEAGINKSWTTQRFLVKPGSSVETLPRLVVGDWKPSQLAAQILRVKMSDLFNGYTNRK